MKLTSATSIRWWLLLVCMAVLLGAGCKNASRKSPDAQGPETAETEPLAEDGMVPAESALQDAVNRADLRQQRAGALVERFIALGSRNKENGNLEEALQNYTDALDIDPSNEEARAGLNEVSGVLNQTPGSVAAALDEGVDRKNLQVQEARIKAENAVRRGRQAFEAEDYDSALRRFEDAPAILTWFPYDLDTSFDRGSIRDYLTRAEDLRKEQSLAKDKERAERIRIENEEEATRAAESVRERVASLFRDADQQFSRGNFQVAAKLAEAILELDYENEGASELLEFANHAHHAKMDDSLLRDYSEEWRRTFEGVRMSMMPQNGIVEFPRGWQENQGRRRPREFTERGPGMSQEESRIRNLLSEIKIAPEFEDQPLEEVMDFFHAVSGLNFVVARAVTEELSESDLTVSLNVSDISIEKSLNLITTLKGLVWRVEDSVVKLTTAQDVTGDAYLELYNVRDLITPIVDYPGDEIYLKGSSGFESFEDDFEDLEEPEPAIATDRLVSLITDNLAPDAWDPPASIEPREGTLVIMQTREVHRMISEMLDDLRGSQGTLVHIESRFLSVEDNFLEDVGVDFRGLGDDSGGGGVGGKGSNEPLDDLNSGTPDMPGGSGTDVDAGMFYNDGSDGDIRGRVENLLDDTLGEEGVLTGSGGFTGQFTYLDDTEVEAILRAVRKSERVNSIQAPSLLIANNERASLQVINQVSYIKDFDVEIAQAAQIADPIVDVISDGVILDVKPVVSADRRFVTLELRPTVSQLKRPIQFRDVSFAIGNAGRLQLPELEIQRVRTTVTIPDGGTLLLGGLKIAQERDTKSGVPVLSDIPIISFLFSRQGQYNRYKNLMILLNVRVVIMNEYEPGLGVAR